MVRAFTHGAMCHRNDPSWGGPIELVQLQPEFHNWYVLFCLWDDAYKIMLVANQKK